tara:strand:- start:159 stop:668 length:510 start_codon:yes stop_codon:yes gene_type:complete
MEIFDAPYWDIATLFSLDDFRVYRIERDKELGASILDVAESWWDKHVQDEIPPDVDATKACMHTLAAMNPRIQEEELRVATVAEKDLHEKIIEARKEMKEAENKKKELENLLRAKIGDSVGIKGVATWKVGRPRKVFNKDAFKEKHPDLFKKFITEMPGTRILRIKEAT